MNAPGSTVFPKFTEGTTHTSGISNGLTKRELFAAMAMQGSMADGTYITDSRAEWQVRLARDAVIAADALLAELAKKLPCSK